MAKGLLAASWDAGARARRMLFAGVCGQPCRPNDAGAWRSKATRCPRSPKLQSWVPLPPEQVAKAPAGSGVSMRHRLLRWMRCCLISLGLNSKGSRSWTVNPLAGGRHVLPRRQWLHFSPGGLDCDSDWSRLRALGQKRKLSHAVSNRMNTRLNC